MEFAHPQEMSTRIARSGQPGAEALHGPGGYDYVILRMEAQGLRGFGTEFVKKWLTASSNRWKEKLGAHYCTRHINSDDKDEKLLVVLHECHEKTMSL